MVGSLPRMIEIELPAATGPDLYRGALCRMM